MLDNSGDALCKRSAVYSRRQFSVRVTEAARLDLPPVENEHAAPGASVCNRDSYAEYTGDAVRDRRHCQDRQRWAEDAKG